MGNCNNCKWWDNPNSLSVYGRCISRMLHDDIIAPPQYQKDTLFFKNFCCIYFEMLVKPDTKKGGKDESQI